MNRRDFVKGSLTALAGASLLSACGGKTSSQPASGAPGTPAPGGGKQEIGLALLAPLTGIEASWGPLQAKGFQHAVDDLNASGGIKSMGGATIKLTILDTETKPEVAASQAERAAQDRKVVMITGCNQSGASVVVAQVAQRNSIPFITGTDADPMITEQGSKYSFRVPGTTEIFPRDMLQWVKYIRDKKGLSVNKLAILSSSSLLGQTANKFAQQWAGKLGFEIVDIGSYDSAQVRDFTGQISKYKAAGVEVFLGTHDPQPAILVARAMKALNWSPPIFGGIYGSICNPDWLAAVGNDGNNAFNAVPWAFNAGGLGLETFNKNFTGKYGGAPDTFVSSGYAVVAVLADALERAGVADRSKLRDAIAATNLKPGDRGLFQMNGVQFDEKGSNTKASTFVIMSKNKDVFAVYPEQYAVEQPVVPRPSWDKL